MKKIFAFMLALIMTLCSFPAAVFAINVSTENTAITEEVSEAKVIEFDATVDENGLVAIPETVTSSLVVDQTWSFTNHHTGADRTYSSNSIAFSARITDSNGNSVGDQVSIKLKDYYGNTQTFTVYANGGWYNYYNISIISGRTYYFYYSNLSSSTRTLKIHMQIYV